ncbi:MULTISPECIES: CPBP family intramembrane glutamic endopeptidase [unclassified Agrococcus]|uniref:CPBP family intramembrane glutamic endopeptidase n=1 Tax=unclassified Agrococcus TaxID=2615065 RepID=UPI003610B832
MSDTTLRPAPTVERPGWPELAAGAIAFLLGLVGTVALLTSVDLEPVTAGLVQYALSGTLGLLGFTAAFAVRIRRLDVLGVRRASGRWLAIGAASGVGTFVLSLVVGVVMSLVLPAPENIQSDYQAAAAGGALAFVATLLLGSVLTPLGEEAFFRGVVANAFGRWSAWVAVPASAAIFALAHGVNAVLPVAFVVGVATALLFRRTGSIWPGVLAHLVHNTLATLFPLVVLPLLA